MHAIRTNERRPPVVDVSFLFAKRRPTCDDTKLFHTSTPTRQVLWLSLSLDVKAATTLYSNSSQPRLFGDSVARSLGLKDHSHALADSWSPGRGGGDGGRGRNFLSVLEV